MDIISQVTCAMQTVFAVADVAAVTSGFLKRKRKLTGSGMVQTLVLGWLSNLQSTYDELALQKLAINSAGKLVNMSILKKTDVFEITEEIDEVEPTLDQETNSVESNAEFQLELLKEIQNLKEEMSQLAQAQLDLAQVIQELKTNGE